MLSFRRMLYITCGVLLCVYAAPHDAQAALCSTYDAGNTPRTSLGAPYDLFDTNQRLLFSATCAGDTLTVTLGNTVHPHLMYKTVYVEFTPGIFTPFQITPTHDRINYADWALSETATVAIPIPSHARGTSVNVFAYMCQIRIDGSNRSVKCGCNEQSRQQCVHTHGTHMGTWNYQKVAVPADSMPSMPAPPLPLEEKDVYAPTDITHVFMLTGQSNALGAWTRTGGSEDVPHKRILAYASGSWRQAQFNQDWFNGWPRWSGTQGSTPSNNLLFHFAKAVVERDPHAVVGIILAADSGKPISYWNAGSAFSRRISAHIQGALDALPQKEGLDAILWHQGEADGGGTARDVTGGTTAYRNAFQRLVDRWRDERWFSGGKPVICGEVANAATVNRELRAITTNNDPWTGCARGEGFEK